MSYNQQVRSSNSEYWGLIAGYRGKVILFVIACMSLVGLFCAPFAGETSEPVERVEEPTATVLSPTPTPDYLFFDDFSVGTSGWEVGTDSGGSVGYVDGAYAVISLGSRQTIWGASPFRGADIVIEVETTQISAPANDNNDYGIICRQQDEGGYFLLISGDGYFSILKNVAGEYQNLVAWTRSDVINQGNAANVIQAECVGNEISLIVNGQLLASVRDDTYSEGGVSLTATSYETEPTEVHFDNLIIRTSKFKIAELPEIDESPPEQLIENREIVYSSGGEFIIIDPDGDELGRVPNLPGGAFNPVWSPDGTQIAFIRITYGAANVYTIGVNGDDLTQLTDLEFNISQPTWSPDGNYLAFTFNDGNDDSLYVIKPDGTCFTKLYTSETFLGNADWSPHGDVIALSDGLDVVLLDLETYETQKLTNYNRRYMLSSIAWSPDGEHLTFHLDVSGDPEVYMYDINTFEMTQLTESPSWDQSPDWSTDGQYVVFASIRDGELKIYKINVQTLETTQLSTDYGANPSWQHVPLPDYFVPEIPCADG